MTHEPEKGTEVAKKLDAMSNDEVVVRLMNYSKFGALAHAFVIEAISKYAAACAAADPKVFDSPMLNGAAWVGVAKEIDGVMSEKYGRA